MKNLEHSLRAARTVLAIGEAKPESVRAFSEAIARALVTVQEEAARDERAACIQACEETAATLDRAFRANPDHNDDVGAGARACVEVLRARGDA